MKLTKINKIKNFGVFSNFVWKTDLQPFSSFNIFYGWNYSGKTTLSRIFRCFESKTIHSDYSISRFEIEDEANGTHNETSLHRSVFSVRVFNNDYIIDNLRWYSIEDDIEPILLLGQESIDLTNKLENEKRNLELIETQKENLRNEKDSKISEMSKALTTKAKQVKEELHLLNFTKSHFEPLVENLSNQANLSKNLLSSEEANNLKTVLLKSEKKDTVSNIFPPKPNLEVIFKMVESLLGRTVKSKVIEKLKNNPRLNEWVRTGKAIHSDKNSCEFCGNILPNDLIQNLNNHFSTEYDDLIKEIDSQIRQIKSQIMNMSFHDSVVFYVELQGEYSRLIIELKSEIEKINNKLNEYCEKLLNKKQKAFEEVKLENNELDFKKLDLVCSKINLLINKHNDKSRNFENEKKEAKEKLIDNFAYEFFTENKYSDYKAELKTKDITLSNLDEQILEINFNIVDYEKKLSDTVKGAEKINEYLTQYFGKNDIKVTVNSDDKFQLTRDGQIAKNLSEGEKTAIAFAYFIASLEDKNTNLADTIVFIDDPISSLDSNHLFNTYSFIKNKFYEFDETDRKHKCKAAQLFISTHNFEFFSLVKDWMNKLKNNDKSFYLVEKNTSESGSESEVKELPIELLKFKSEYVYLFSIIYEFHNSTSNNFRFLYNLPNIVRRFIESFCGFKYLSTRNIEENLNLLISDGVKRERVRKFVHYYSHSLGTNTVMGFSNPTESREVVKIVIESLESNDLQHYNSLLTQVTSA